jgi:26S proteasome regulatory subunit N3
MEVEAAAAAPAESAAGAGAPKAALPECEILACLVTTLLLLDAKAAPAAHAVASAAVARVGTFKRRSLDALAAKLYFYYALSAETCGDAALAAVRPRLLALHRTAALRHDDAGAEVLINALLRNLLHFNQVEAAEQLRSKLTWPEKHSNAQYCRYLFYLGRIRAVQLAYSDAKECLAQAARKAPPGAHGFRAQLHTWLVVVRLLLGEVPERRDFRQPALSVPLAPYFALTNAVRTGDLGAFRAVSDAHEGRFAADKVANLIVRLRRNVIRTGLRRIGASYSRISLADVAAKLGLASAEDAECIVAKAIRDGGLEASIDHDAGVVLSKPPADVYGGGEPAAAFHARTTFCLDMHNEAVQGLRFPPGAHKAGAAETAEQRRERLALEAELAEHMAEDGGGMDEF